MKREDTNQVAVSASAEVLTLVHGVPTGTEPHEYANTSPSSDKSAKIDSAIMMLQ